MDEMASPQDFGWTASVGTDRAVLRGPGGLVLSVEALQGTLEGVAFYGLKALSNRGCESRIKTPWVVTVPRQFRGRDNTGANRKIVELRCNRQLLVLRFNKEVPRGLQLALKSIFEKKTYRKDNSIGVKIEPKE